MALPKVLKNWPYKMLAVTLALLLWNHVQGEINPVTSISTKATLQYTNLQDGSIVALTQSEVPIILQGPKLEVESVDAKKDISAWVDLAKLPTGNHTVPIKVSIEGDTHSNIKAVPAVRDIGVTIEEISHRTIPVEVKTKTSPPIGWATTKPVVTPAWVKVSGRSSLVSSIARVVVTVDPTPLKPMIDDYVEVTAIDSRGREVKSVDINPDGVRVVVKLVEAPATKVVFVSANVVGQPQFPNRVTKVTVTPDSVTIKGKPESLVGTSTVLTDDVDVSGATGEIVRRVPLRLPPGVDVEGSRTVKVTVRIQPQPTH